MPDNIHYPEEQLEVVVRSSRRPDVHLQVSSLDTGKRLRDLYYTEAQVPGPVRMFYGGKELKDELLLAQIQVKSGVVVQAMG